MFCAQLPSAACKLSRRRLTANPSHLPMAGSFDDGNWRGSRPGEDPPAWPVLPGWIDERSAWGEHPIAPRWFFVLTSIMREQHIFRNLQSVETPVPAQHSDRTGIEIDWVETIARSIMIRESYSDAARKAHPIRLQRSCRQRNNARPALIANVQKLSASRLGSRAT